MKKRGKEDKASYIRKYVYLGVILALVVLCYFILRDFLISFIAAFIFAYLLKPLQKRLSKHLPKKLSALIIIIWLLIILVALLVLFSYSLISQFSKFIAVFSWDQIFSLFSQLPYYESLAQNLDVFTSKIGESLFSMVYSLISSIPNMVINMLIIVFTTYYLLIDLEKIEAKIASIIPFKNKKEILADAEKISKEVIYGTLIIALIETAVAIVAFKLLGISFYLVLGLLIGLLAFIPLLGPILIWGPLALYELAAKDYTSAIGVLIVGLIISIGIDFFLKVKILGQRTKIHPVIMLLGVLGGVKLFGLMGFIIGPLILGTAIIIFSNIHKEKEKQKKRR
ncbi:MAG: AI-2E family transporter [Candidatus Pacearchaeota archaeon]|jgi:predicted PurR-regulated permease PerM